MKRVWEPYTTIWKTPLTTLIWAIGFRAGVFHLSFGRHGASADEYRRGLMVMEVSSRGPAYRELAKNDHIIIQALHPKRDIRTAADLEAAVKAVKSGEVLSLLVYSIRSGSTQVVNLSLEQQ